MQTLTFLPFKIFYSTFTRTKNTAFHKKKNPEEIGPHKTTKIKNKKRVEL